MGQCFWLVCRAATQDDALLVKVPEVVTPLKGAALAPRVCDFVGPVQRPF